MTAIDHRTKKSFQVYVIEYERHLSNPERFPLSEEAAEIVTRGLEIAGYLVKLGFSEKKTLDFILSKYPDWTPFRAKQELARAKDIWALDGKTKHLFEQRRIRRELWALVERHKGEKPEVVLKALALLEKMTPPEDPNIPDVEPIFLQPIIYISDPALLGFTQKEIAEIDQKTQVLKEKWLEKNAHNIEPQDGNL